jgi:MacB-like periplasmic core domain/FtsX-like permease family
MRRTPTVTFVITATLAIAIGANTAMFTLVDAVLLKTLPVPHPEDLKQLVWVARRFGFSPSYNGRASSNAAGERVATSFSYPVLTYLRERTTTFSDVFVFEEPQPLSVVVSGGSQLVESQFVSGNFFRGLDVDAMRGRTLTDEDDRPDAPPVAVISHAFWHGAFGGDAQIIGRTIAVNGTSVTIVGVTRPSFFGVLPGSRPAVTLPLSLSVIDASTPPGTLARAGYWGFAAMGRIKTGETAAHAQAETETLVRQAILSAPPAAAYDLPRIVLDEGGRGLAQLRREFSGALRLLMAIAGAILHETLARRLFGAASPIGQRVMHPGAAPADAMEVIGVAGDAKYGSLRETAPSTIYEPYRSGPQRVMTFAVRTAGDPEALVAAMRAAAAVDPSVPLFDVWTQSTQIDQAIRQERVFANLVSGFALLALLLACLGIYGTLSYSVARRTPEIGLRMALGAGRSNVVVLVLRESAAPVLLGAIIGVAAAAAATRVIHSMLFGIAHDDVATVIVALLILIASACAAALIPSTRASRVEPMHALRCD